MQRVCGFLLSCVLNKRRSICTKGMEQSPLVSVGNSVNECALVLQNQYFISLVAVSPELWH